MVYHPRENWNRRRRPDGLRPGLTRRDFISRATAMGLSLPAISALLAACGGAEGETGDIAIGTPSSPVTQPLFDDNPAIESGLTVESGPLQIFNWADYLNPDVLPRFTEETGIPYEVRTFFNEEEAVRVLSSGEVAFDVWFPVASTVGKAVAGQLIQPLNHDYLPNLGNVWPVLQDPFYDQGSLYTTPYVVYQTGIGWRTDMVDSADVEGVDNPWDVFWNPKYAGITGLYDDFRETLKVAMFHNGVSDPDAATQEDIDAAAAALIELVDLVNIRYTIDGAYSGIPEGRFGLHHAWSGDMVAVPFYFPVDGDPSVSRYMWPAKGPNPVGAQIANDTMAVVKGAPHPVAAHTFIDWMLNTDNALENFGWVGYQPPHTAIDPETLVADEWVPEYLESTIVREEDFSNPVANVPIQLDVDTEAAWFEAWTQVQGGV
ncbi:MAG TPA: extracellular solute-binding protein [Acidimicrobiia bacterium]|nr:extracellular solute-binding protein [Acidimicrobiia bacterium]